MYLQCCITCTVLVCNETQQANNRCYALLDKHKIIKFSPEKLEIWVPRHFWTFQEIIGLYVILKTCKVLDIKDSCLFK